MPAVYSIMLFCSVLWWGLWRQKSTPANLIMGFWKPQKGKIQINGVDTKNMSEKQLNLLRSIVQQEVFLFNMRMEENIRARKPTTTMEEIIAVDKKACIVLQREQQCCGRRYSSYPQWQGAPFLCSHSLPHLLCNALIFYVISGANYFVELMWFCSSSAWQIGLSCGNPKN
ncbi:MAG: ATP-binding cassette domain-containing protein [Pygmaiobacter sp.]|nr:ATP-binding cassette domain-containing protein [Pygmaiobacter sp.]